MKKEFQFSAKQLENSLGSLEEKGITEISVNDVEITGNRSVFLRFLGKARTQAPNVHFSFTLDIEQIDTAVIKALSEVFSSITIPLPVDAASNGAVRKIFTKKTSLLNEWGIVFGFHYPENVPSFKGFKTLLDFTFSLYPNHVDFNFNDIKPTGTLSTVDIKKIQNICFGVDVFYNFGRGVPWFLAVLQPLHIKATQFFSDFAEWQLCNNCHLGSGFMPQDVPHLDIEKMQLLFLKLKYEEKEGSHYFPAVTDFIKLQGAFSRAASEGMETILELSYHPEDLLSPQIWDIPFFSDNACMEFSSVRVYPGEYEPLLEIL